MSESDYNQYDDEIYYYPEEQALCDEDEIVDEASDINKKNTSVSEFCNFTSDQGNKKTQSRRRDMTYKPAGRKTF